MLYATIMAGGAGTRFWPASRKLYPKQLLTLVGDRSMIQATVDRLDGLVAPENLLIVTNQVLVEAISQQLPKVPRQSIIGEPAKRDTAPCIGLAAALIAARDPEAIMIVTPADHAIQPSDSFRNALKHAASLVEANPKRLVTFGIKPEYASEAFGYIERAAKPIETPLQQTELPTYPVLRFREKPDRNTAAEFLKAGTFFWNSGIFVWKASTILNALKKYEPEIAGHLEKIADSVGSRDFANVLNREFTAIKGKSIDYAVMERYPDVLMVEAPFQWDDLGNWSAIPRLQGVDADNNTVQAKHLGLNTSNSIIRAAQGHLIVTIGVKNLVVVHTPNATLIADRQEEASIKEIVNQIEKNGWDEYL
jgi:mannose-1-phosphate guanylyltransferase